MMSAMRLRSVVLAGLAVVGLAVSVAPSQLGATQVTAHSALPHAIGRTLNGTSSNWSGWADVGKRYTSTAATWRQPSVHCTLLAPTYSAFWVGLDGVVSGTVEQTGTSADCDALGRAHYYGWYEFFPNFPVNYSNPVVPGDLMQASTTYIGSGRYRLILIDVTRKWSHTVTGSVAGAANKSAEVIAEAPSSGTSGRVLPLANFGSVTFTSATVNGAPLGKVATPQPITMATRTYVKAVPSGLTGANSFTVTWRHR
jgi:hypothetical protein